MVWESPVIPLEHCSGTRLADLYYAWEYGNLTYKLDPIQKATLTNIEQFFADQLDSFSRLWVNEWSRRFGKDFLTLVFVRQEMRKNKDAIYHYGTAFEKDIKKILIPVIKRIEADCPKEYRLKTQREMGIYRDPITNSELRLVGLDRNPEGIRGNRGDGVVVTEYSYCDNIDVSETAFTPMLVENEEAWRIYNSTPGEHTAHKWHTEIVPRAKRKGGYSIQVLDDCPRLTERQIEAAYNEFGGRKSTKSRREYKCEHIGEETRMIVPEWVNNKAVCCVDSYDRPDYCLGFLSIDPGQKHLHAHVYAYLDWAKDILVFTKAYTLKSPNTETIAKHIKDDEKELWKGYAYWMNDRVHQNPYRRVSDTNLQLINDLGSIYKLPTEPIKKTDLHTMVADFRTRVQNKKVRFLPGTEELQTHIDVGIWDKNRKKFEYISEELGHVDELAAAIYLNRIANQCRNINPWPPELEHMESPNYEPQIPLPRSNGWKKARNLC